MPRVAKKPTKLKESKENKNGTLKKQKQSLNHSRQAAIKEQRSRQTSRLKEYNIGTAGDAGRFYKFTGKQTRNWKKLNKNLHEYLLNLVESGVKSVSSKPAFAKEEDIQILLQRLKTRLKGKLSNLKAPKTKYGDYCHLRSNLARLTDELKLMKDQEIQLEKAIRQEERLIESLEANECGDEIDTQLTVKVPADILNLPKMVASIT